MNYARRVVRIVAEDSPNVQRYLSQKARGEEPDYRVVIPGVLTAREYEWRRKHWDAQRQCEGLDARWYQGPELMLFPPEWLRRSAELAEALKIGKLARRAKGMGIDPAEGGDHSDWAVADELGLLELVSFRTSDTTKITATTLELIRKWQLDPTRVCFDRGGGGKEHADRLRLQGYNVRTVAFGEAVSLDIKRGLHLLSERKDVREEKYVYKNRRAQMYHELSLDDKFAIPRELGTKVFGEGRKSLFDQLAKMPKLKDEEGRYWLPPKDKRDPNSKVKCIRDMIGHSPDEADAVVLAKHSVVHKVFRATAGAG